VFLQGSRARARVAKHVIIMDKSAPKFVTRFCNPAAKNGIIQDVVRK
jgi:hypothetical protein